MYSININSKIEVSNKLFVRKSVISDIIQYETNEQVLIDNGLTTTDFAPLIKSPVLDNDGNETGNHNYGMRYQELVGILIKAVQELSAKVKALEDAQ